MPNRKPAVGELHILRLADPQGISTYTVPALVITTFGRDDSICTLLLGWAYAEKRLSTTVGWLEAASIAHFEGPLK